MTHEVQKSLYLNEWFQVLHSAYSLCFEFYNTVLRIEQYASMCYLLLSANQIIFCREDILFSSFLRKKPLENKKIKKQDAYGHIAYPRTSSNQ